MEMRVSDLSRYGLPERVLNLWRQRQGEVLLPVQSRAVRQGLLAAPDGHRPNLLISAPTSAGKSFCAEMAAVMALTARQKVILLFPLKSLAEEQYRLWRETYGPLGIKCLIVTGDHPENDRAFARGDYHLAVAIYEKLDMALTRRLDLLRTVGLVVIDEIQMIAEPGRGAVLERLLTKILACSYRPMLVALTGTLSGGDIEPLAGWLEARLVEETVRPRDLIRGVAADGVFRFRSFNGSVDGSEPWPTPDSTESAGGASEALVTWLLERLSVEGTPALIFLKSRADAVGLAMALAARSSWSSAKTALSLLADEEPSALLRMLCQVLSRGIAFHSADLSSRERSAVEKAFVEGEIRVLCSTTTLSMGVNLPAESVFLETVKYAAGDYGSRAELVPISRTEFENMTGRAGRFGGDTSRPGRAIMLADSAFDQEVLWQRYVAPQESAVITSAFDSLPLEDWLLHFVATGLARTMADLPALLARTFRRRLEPGRSENIEDTLAGLIEHGFVTASGSDKAQATLSITRLGQVAAQTGLGVAAVAELLAILDDKGYPDRELGWICLALASSAMELPPGLLSRYELTNNLPVRMLYQRFDHAVEEAAFLLPEDHRRSPLAFRPAAALKAALLLDDWRRLIPLNELEERYQLHLGQVQALGSGCAHLLRSLGSLVGALDQESPLPEMLTDLAFSVRWGLPPEMEPLVRCTSDILCRSDYQRLHQEGLDTPEALASASDEQLKSVVLCEAKILQVNKIIDALKVEDDMQTVALHKHRVTSPVPNSIEIDGSFEGDRFLIRINGMPVSLTGKSFKYLTKLAWSRLHNRSGWIFKEDIEVGFNQARYLYRMKNEINAGFASNWPVVENNRLGYYRLSIEPERISLNLENLKDHPDYEVRSLFMASTGMERVN